MLENNNHLFLSDLITGSLVLSFIVTSLSFYGLTIIHRLLNVPEISLHILFPSLS